MQRIVKIQTYPTHSGTVAFAGTLRNEKRFEMRERVFIQSGGTMHQCTIVGVELPPASNPEYIYKIELPKELIEKNEGETYVPNELKDRVSLTCEHIFRTTKEARISAVKEADMKHRLNIQAIDRFFKQFEDEQK